MKIEDLSKLQIASTAGFESVYARLGGHNLMVLYYPLIEEKSEGLKIVALIRAAPIMLEALETAVEAHEKALKLTLSQIADAGNMVEHIGFPEWYEKAKAAIDAAKNTNETL